MPEEATGGRLLSDNFLFATGRWERRGRPFYKTALEFCDAKPQGEGGPRAGQALMAYLLCSLSDTIVKLHVAFVIRKTNRKVKKWKDEVCEPVYPPVGGREGGAPGTYQPALF
jgi:hypothetical protein